MGVIESRSSRSHSYPPPSASSGKGNGQSHKKNVLTNYDHTHLVSPMLRVAPLNGTCLLFDYLTSELFEIVFDYLTRPVYVPRQRRTSTGDKFLNQPTQTDFQVASVIKSEDCMEDHRRGISSLKSTRECIHLQDLLSFALTCKYSYTLIRHYIQRYLSKHFFDVEQIERFKSVTPLLVEEVSLLKTIHQYTYDSRDCKAYPPYTLKHLLACTWFSNIRRACVYESEFFAHLNAPYIVKEKSDSFYRDTVVLKSVCWLQFIKSFVDVQPGIYFASVRVRLDKRAFEWPSSMYNFFGHDDDDNVEIAVGAGGGPSYHTSIRVYPKTSAGCGVTCQVSQTPTDNDSRMLCEAKVLPKNWNDICHTHLKNRRLSGCRIIVDDTDFEWIWVVLDSFKNDKLQDLQFEFRDTENPWWKCGMEWDFIQLKRVALLDDD